MLSCGFATVKSSSGLSWDSGKKSLELSTLSWTKPQKEVRIGYNEETCQNAYFPGRYFNLDEGVKWLGCIQAGVKNRPHVDGGKRDLERCSAEMRGSNFGCCWWDQLPASGLRPQAANGWRGREWGTFGTYRWFSGKRVEREGTVWLKHFPKGYHCFSVIRNI